MTSDGAALLRAICAQPREDTPRLMYADWLEENGQPERAEFIRFQCEFPEWDESHPRYQELGERHRQFEPFFKEWVKALPQTKGVRWWKDFWHRGFIDSVTFASTKVFADHADAVFAASPLRLVKVERVSDRTIGRVLGSAYPLRLEHLILSGSYTTASVPQIAACANLANLEVLSAWGGCTDEGAETLAASSHLGALTCLSLSNHTLTDRGVIALIDSKPLRGVKTLVLHGVQGLSQGTVRRLKKRYGQAL